MIDKIQLAILRQLRDGQPVKREHLAFRVGVELGQSVGDRTIRAAIELLRLSTGPGCLIVSSSRGAGYRLARKYDDILDSYAEERRRALTLLRRLRVQRQHAEAYFFRKQVPLPWRERQ